MATEKNGHDDRVQTNPNFEFQDHNFQQAGGQMLHRVERAPIKVKRLGQATWDGVAWIIATPIAFMIRYDFSPSHSLSEQVWLLALALALMQIILGFTFQLYRGRYRIGSVDEVLGISFIVFVITLASSLYLSIVRPENFPRSIPVIAALIAIGIMLAGRLALRLYKTRLKGNSTGQRALIYGAGETADNLLRLILQESTPTFVPVGLIDDDPNRQRLRLYGYKVLGTGEGLAKAIINTNATLVIVAIATITSAKLRAINEVCEQMGVELQVVPTANALVHGQVSLRDISQVTVEDLLGRQPIDPDTSSISEFLGNKRVLITGAGGSIGSELARQVAQFAPSSLAFLDRDESALLNLQLDLEGHGLLNSEQLILADIRDAQRMNEIMDLLKPEIVFHAAALKHLSLLESYPEEAVKTNVLGTANVLSAAASCGVETFINISTDKAADPYSVLGKSKRVTERLTCGSSENAGHRYLSVRFGNVLGSRGSVLHTFRSQIDAGGPVTVTHPEVTRYFMTIPEAVHLVLQAATFGDDASTLILDMGDPVLIADVAQQMIAKSGKSIDIAFVGLRPGEKMHELLTSGHESPVETIHPLITSVKPNPLSLKALSINGSTITSTISLLEFSNDNTMSL